MCRSFGQRERNDTLAGLGNCYRRSPPPPESEKQPTRGQSQADRPSSLDARPLEQKPPPRCQLLCWAESSRFDRSIIPHAAMSTERAPDNGPHLHLNMMPRGAPPSCR
ncbi:hypothetical protein FALCPG4_19033 [Fusarium falciforme]